MTAALIALLTVLLGGTSTYALHEHKQLAVAHTAALQAQSENAQAQTAIVSLKAAESTQQAAQAKEDEAREAQEDARSAKGQEQQVALTAAKASLEQTPPAIEPAKKFVDLAAQAGDKPTGDTVAQGLALAQATIAAQAQKIADMSAQIEKQNATIDSQGKTITAAHADNLAAVKQISDLTGTVAVHVEKEGQKDAVIAQVTDQSKSLLDKVGLLTAQVGRYVAAVVALALVAIGGFYLWRIERIHHAYTRAAHGDTQTKLAAEQAAHAATKAAHINPPTI